MAEETREFTLKEQIRLAREEVATWPPFVRRATTIPQEYLWGPGKEPTPTP